MYEDLVNPGDREKREKENLRMHDLSYWSSAALNFFSWILNQYMKNFFLALILLWLWWYEDKGSLKIRNPFSFLLCLLIYPIVIIRALSEKIRNNGRYFMMNVEYRRHHKDLFALFSEDEISEIKRAAKSKINLTEYRRQLQLKNLTVNHSLIAALAVSIVFISLPQFHLEANTYKSDVGKAHFAVSVEAPTDVGVFQDYHLVHLDFDKFICFNASIESIIFIEILTERIRTFEEKCLDGYVKRLKAIPVLVNNYFNLSLKSIINKIGKNEKIYYFNCCIICCN